MHPEGDACMQLGAELVGAVGGERHGGRALAGGRLAEIPIDRRGGGIDDRDAPGAGGIQHRDGSGLVHPVGLDPVFVPARDRRDRGEMKATVHAVQLGTDAGRIGDIAGDQGGGRVELGGSAGREIVEHPHAIAAGDQCVDEMGADEACAARHQVPAHHPSQRKSR